MVRRNRFLTETILSCEGERHDSDPPWGFLGGQDGLNASLVAERAGGREEPWPAKFTGLVLGAGDALLITEPNSGGYGDPLERKPELVLSDVLDGFTTLELAERDYGVVLDLERAAVEMEATARLRARLRAERPGGSSRSKPPVRSEG